MGFIPILIKANSSIGRALVSKMRGCGFDSYLACCGKRRVMRRFSRKFKKEHSFG